jgi:hypothetical protein
VHFTTIARWRAQNWKVEAADHPLEIARGHIESLAPLVSGDPATNLQDLIDDPAHKRDLNELTDGELLRKAAREIAIATAVLSKAIQKRTTVALNMEEVTHALLSIAACLAALPGAFDQAISLDAADQSLGARTRP